LQASNQPSLLDNAAKDLRKIERVAVIVPARLHVGFVDLNGGLGRRFGSLGIALDTPSTSLSLTWSDALAAEGPDAERARDHLIKLSKHFKREPLMKLAIDRTIPAHVGLGSGTQLSLATAVAFCRLHGLAADTRFLAQLLERGLRSSIGIATFEEGGVIVDGGRGETDAPPPVLSRLPFPEDWRILLIFDNGRRGLHGSAEVDAFHRLPPFPAETSAHLCRLVLMVALPALAEQDLDRFGGAIAELQRAIGDYFAPVQGARFMSPTVADVLGWLESEGVRGIGQSSWGPTGFAILGSQRDAERLQHQAERRWPADTGLSFALSRGRNRGGDVTITPARGQ
jgi:beta-RFAP synthase